MPKRTTFSCARAADLSSGELVEVGEIQFEPGSLSRPLYLPQSVVADWRRSEIQRLDASMARDGRGGVRASGSFDVLDQQSSSQSGTFDLRADSQGADVHRRSDRPSTHDGRVRIVSKS